jgi:hypothetical protein
MNTRTALSAAALSLLLVLALSHGARSEDKRVDVNNADLLELGMVKEVGPVLAKEIIDGRPYKSMDDLVRVKGISRENLRDLKKVLRCASVKKPVVKPEPKEEPKPEPKPEKKPKEEPKKKPKPEEPPPPPEKTLPATDAGKLELLLEKKLIEKGQPMRPAITKEFAKQYGIKILEEYCRKPGGFVCYVKFTAGESYLKDYLKKFEKNYMRSGVPLARAFKLDNTDDTRLLRAWLLQRLEKVTACYVIESSDRAPKWVYTDKDAYHIVMGLTWN